MNTFGEVETFEKITEDWFHEYFSRQSDVHDLRTNIGNTDQDVSFTQFAGDSIPVNKVTYDQTFQYTTALNTTVNDMDLVTRPFKDENARDKYAAELKSQLESFKHVVTPIAIPQIETVANKTSSGGSTGLIVVVVVGVVVAITIGIVVALKCKRNQSRPKTREDPPPEEEEEQVEEQVEEPVENREEWEPYPSSWDQGDEDATEAADPPTVTAELVQELPGMTYNQSTVPFADAAVISPTMRHDEHDEEELRPPQRPPQDTDQSDGDVPGETRQDNNSRGESQPPPQQEEQEEAEPSQPDIRDAARREATEEEVRRQEDEILRLTK